MMEIKSLQLNYRMEVPIGKDPRFSPFPQKHSRKITLPSPPAVCFLSRQRAAFLFLAGKPAITSIFNYKDVLFYGFFRIRD